MADPPDYAELAKRYVDLWQDHLMAIAGDPALAESMARLFLGGAAPAMGETGDGAFASAARAAAAAAASPQRERGLAELARRLADLEARIGALETRARPSRGSAAKKPRRRRT
ncbi:MAG: hypothetical protein ACREFQ_21890 [Stellaceae bacterium]